MEEDVVEFYRRVVFGKLYSEYRKKFLNGNVDFNECWHKSGNKLVNGYRNDIKFLCFLTAWNDMSAHQKDIGKKYDIIATNIGFALIKNPQGEIINRVEFLKEVFNKVESILDKLNSQNAIEEFYKNAINIDKTTLKNILEYGKIQKVVNMYYKYIYTFSISLYDNSGKEIIPAIFTYDIKKDFENCDCPIDNYILDSIYKKEKKDIKKVCGGELPKRPIWSLMDEDTYKEISGVLNDYIKKSSMYAIPLDYDFKNFG